MQIGGIDVSIKGKEFEEFFREELLEKLVDSEYFSDSFVSEDALEVVGTSGNVKEEIDLIWIFGKNIFVCELKCSIYPSTPLEAHRYNETSGSISTDHETWRWHRICLLNTQN